jgi:hypothetical protein
LRELTVGEVLNDALCVKVPFTPGTFLVGNPSTTAQLRLVLELGFCFMTGGLCATDQ